MCRRKPGSRCYQHSAAALSAAQSRVNSARARIHEVLATPHPSPQLVAATAARLTAATQRLDRAEREFYATRTGANTLTSILARDNLDPDYRARLQKLKAQSTALKLARKEQVAAMPTEPPVGADPDLQNAYDRLGRYRAVLADVDAQILGTHGHRPPAALISLRAEAERDAFVSDVEYRMMSSNNRPNPHFLHPAEQAALLTQPAVRGQIAYLSHMRAAAEHGQHSIRMTNLIADREAQLHAALTDTAPNLAATIPQPDRSPEPEEPPAPAPSRDKGTVAPPQRFAPGQPWRRTPPVPAWRTAWNQLRRNTPRDLLEREGFEDVQPEMATGIINALEDLFGIR